MFAPAFVLWLIGILSQEKLWMLVTGLFNRKSIKLSRAVKYDRNPSVKRKRNPCRKTLAFIKIMTTIILETIAIPAVWVLICFLRGDYYVCAFYPNNTQSLPCQMHKPTMDGYQPGVHDTETEVLIRNLYGQSHIIGWAIVIPGLFVYVLYKCIAACGDKYTYNQSRYIHAYNKLEEEFMAKTIEAHALEKAQENISFFFSQKRDLAEWNKTALIKVKQRVSVG